MASQNPRFQIVKSPNAIWEDSQRGYEVTLRKQRLIEPDSKIFTIGSCFAVEIRNALRELGYTVFPRYSDLEFDRETQFAGKLPNRDNVNHYDTFVIRQEIERSLDRRSWDISDFWQLTDAKVPMRIRHWPEKFQDPYRRHLFAQNLEGIIDLSAKVDNIFDNGLTEADVIIITLGLTECWQNKANNMFICMPPADENDEVASLARFHPSSFQENFDNVKTIVERIHGTWPEKRIVITVSPVSLGRTFTDKDVVVANMTSKSILRAVAGEIIAAYPEVAYLPSYELFARGDQYARDGRHVQLEAVRHIVTTFLETFS